MSNWIEWTPSKTGEVGPGYEPGMALERKIGLEHDWRVFCWSPHWIADTPYRYRWPTAKPVEEVPEWGIKRAYWLAQQERGDGVPLANAFARYIASREDPPEDPLEGFVREMFEVGNAPRYAEDLDNAVQYARDHADALVAALKGDE